MSKKIDVNNVIDEVFPEGQRRMMKRAITKTTEVSPNLLVSTLRIGNDTSVLLTGVDDNGNTHYAMMSNASFEKLKKVKI